jgi:autotransporter passenger strand-loop-strand repeat protein
VEGGLVPEAASHRDANIFPAPSPSASGLTFATAWQYSADTYTNGNVKGPEFLDLDTFSPPTRTIASGEINGVVIAAGDALVVTGSANGTTIDVGGLEEVAGSDNNAIILDGGEQLIANGGVATGAIAYDPGNQFVGSGGLASGTILSGGDQAVYGTAVGTVIESGGLEEVFSGGTTSSTIVSGGTLELQSSAVVSGLIRAEAQRYFLVK